MADTCPFLGPLVPLFWISGDVSSGFQSQSGFCLIRYFCGGECNVHSPRFTSGATLANLLAAGVQPVTSPHACAEVGLGSDSNVQPHEQKTNRITQQFLKLDLLCLMHCLTNNRPPDVKGHLWEIISLFRIFVLPFFAWTINHRDTNSSQQFN